MPPTTHHALQIFGVGRNVGFVLLHDDNLLAVINNLDVVGVTIAPYKADTPSVIDPKAILSCSLPSLLFQAIGRGHLQISEGMCIVEHAQLT
jgi:hypothetical protein